MVANQKIKILEIATYVLNMSIRPNQIYDFRGAFIDHVAQSQKIHDDGISLLANRVYKEGIWEDSLQQYPLIQYRINDKFAEVVGIDEGVKLLEKLMKSGILKDFEIQDQRYPLHVVQSNRQSLVIESGEYEEYMLFHYIPYNHRDDHLYHEQRTMVDKIGILQTTISNAIQNTLAAFGITKEGISVEIIDIIHKDKASYKTRTPDDRPLKETLTSYFMKIRCNVSNLDQLSIGKHKSVGYGVIKKVI